LDGFPVIKFLTLELVDRDLETYIIESLNKVDLGPKIYETDMMKYRIEEYIHHLVPLKNEDMFKDKVFKHIIDIFTTYNSLGDVGYYNTLVSGHKKETFWKLLLKDEKTNFLTFTVKRMIPLAQSSLDVFSQKVKEKFPTDNSMLEKLNEVEYFMHNFEHIFYDCTPDICIMVLSHNDAHILNIMHKPDFSKVYVFDHEYASYNFLGFDIANYIIESQFILEDEAFPYYQFFVKDYDVYKDEGMYECYLKFFDNFVEKKGELFKNYSNFEETISVCKSKEYYYRMMGMSALMWFVFGVIYLDYDTIINKTGYDYFSYCLDRLSIYSKFAKLQLSHIN
jgi:thiamine kinase-like enzyme